jgi:hypothetical protein
VLLPYERVGCHSVQVVEVIFDERPEGDDLAHEVWLAVTVHGCATQVLPQYEQLVR